MSWLALLAASAFAAAPYPTHSCADAGTQDALNAVERRVWLAAGSRASAVENAAMNEQNVKEFQNESVAAMERQLSALPDEVVGRLSAFFRKTLAMREGEDLSAGVLASRPIPPGAGLEAYLETHRARREALAEALRAEAARRGPEIRERQRREASEFKASLELPFYLRPARSAVEGVVDRFVERTGAGVPELEASVVSARASAALAGAAYGELAGLRDATLLLCR
jgi:hypothetical protein